MTAQAAPAPGTEAAPAQSLSRGAVGVALWHIERAHNGTGTWETAHTHLAASARDLIAADHASLFFGAPAVAFALHTAAAGSDRYAGALLTLDATITSLTRRRLTAAHARIDRGERTRPAEYDLLYGLTGLGAYLLQRDPTSEALRDVLAYLVRLTEPLPGDDERLPGWWTHLDPTNDTSEAFPGGHGNLGMAHGIRGPLALMSTALLRGTVVDGQTAAIKRICAWLDAQRQDADTGPWWPQWITLAEHRTRTVVQFGPHRPSWCYGSTVSGMPRLPLQLRQPVGQPARRGRREPEAHVPAAGLRLVDDLVDVEDGRGRGAEQVEHTGSHHEPYPITCDYLRSKGVGNG